MSDGGGAEVGGIEKVSPGGTWSETKPKQSPAPGARRRRTAQPVEGSAGAPHFKPALGFLLAEAVCAHTHNAHASRQLTANSEVLLFDPEQSVFHVLCWGKRQGFFLPLFFFFSFAFQSKDKY